MSRPEEFTGGRDAQRAAKRAGLKKLARPVPTVDESAAPKAKATGKASPVAPEEPIEAPPISGKSRNDPKRLFDTLIPAALKEEARAILAEDLAAHASTHARIDRISAITLKYCKSNNVMEFLRQTKCAGRNPRSAFQPFFKWLCPMSSNSWTLWSRVCEAAVFFKHEKPSTAIAEPTLGNGDMKKLATKYRTQAGLIKTRAKPEPDAGDAGDSDDEADGGVDAVAPQATPTADQLKRRKPIGHGLLNDESRLHGGDIIRLWGFRPTDGEKIVLLFDIEPKPSA